MPKLEDQQSELYFFTTVHIDLLMPQKIKGCGISSLINTRNLTNGNVSTNSKASISQNKQGVHCIIFFTVVWASEFWSIILYLLLLDFLLSKIALVLISTYHSYLNVEANPLFIFLISSSFSLSFNCIVFLHLWFTGIQSYLTSCSNLDNLASWFNLQLYVSRIPRWRIHGMSCPKSKIRSHSNSFLSCGMCTLQSVFI